MLWFWLIATALFVLQLVYWSSLKSDTHGLEILRLASISGIKGYNPKVLLFSKAIPKADAYIKSLFPRPVSGISLIIKLCLDGENVKVVLMFLETWKRNWESLMVTLLKENLNSFGLQLPKIEIISKPSNVKAVSNWYFHSIVRLILKIIKQW